MSDIPTFTVTLQNGNFVFTCPTCGKVNVHGAGIEGHRNSHCRCWPDTGYFIKLADPAPIEEGEA